VTTKIEIYPEGTLPESSIWQSLSFMRCEWPWLFSGAGRLRSRPFPAAIHLACTDGPVLLSYADIVESTAVRDGASITVAGLSNVFTFPPYRREGHAAKIVRAANSHLDDRRRRTEMAILFCRNELVPFYAARGWIAAPPGTVTVAGGGESPLAMVRRGSMRGPDLIASLQHSPIAVAAAW
jgi:hypothetical protein